MTDCSMTASTTILLASMVRVREAGKHNVVVNGGVGYLLLVSAPFQVPWPPSKRGPIVLEMPGRKQW